MASAMPLEPATQAALAAEGRALSASHLASEDLITGHLSPNQASQRRAVMDNQHRPLQFRKVISAELGEQAGDGFAAGADEL
jgi:hypothetical protein